MAEQVFKNKFSTDLRVFITCVKKIDKTRFHKLMKCVADSVNEDNINPNLLDEHDKIFEPRTSYEKDLWQMYRELAKKERITLEKRVKAGNKGGRPPMTAKEKKAKLEQVAKNIGAVGKNQVKITPDFKLPNNEYFNVYRKELPKETEAVEKWLKTAKNDSIVDYDWIGKQIQNFKYRKTGRIL